MVQHSFQNYSHSPIKVEETEQLLINYTYKERLATFLYLGVDALALTIVALFATLIASIDNILGNSISYFFLKIVDDLDSVAMWFVGFIVYVSLIIIFLLKYLRRSDHTYKGTGSDFTRLCDPSCWISSRRGDMWRIQVWWRRGSENSTLKSTEYTISTRY